MISMFEYLRSLTKFIPGYYFFPFFSFSFLAIFNVKRHGQLVDLALYKYFDIFLLLLVSKKGSH